MAIITQEPPVSVQKAGTSSMKSQTQKGPKANSSSINRVNSAAIKYLEAYIKSELGINEIILPRSTHFNKSSQDMAISLPKRDKQTKHINNPEIRTLGSISMSLFFRSIIA